MMNLLFTESSPSAVSSAAYILFFFDFFAARNASIVAVAIPFFFCLLAQFLPLYLISRFSIPICIIYRQRTIYINPTLTFTGIPALF